eukprot:COSAG02_NODE_5706_length_4106_cov_1.601447_1_plen_744_part_00
MGGGRLRVWCGWRRPHGHGSVAMRAMVAWAGVGMVGGLCSHNSYPSAGDLVPFSEWDVSRSDRRCTMESCVEDYNEFRVCPGEGCRTQKECLSMPDDGSECHARCCCQYRPADWHFKWVPGHGDKPLRTPGNLHPRDSCTAVCQRGYMAKESRAPSETFTCSAVTDALEPPANSAFQCVEDTTQYCSAAPPCEGAGCEWAASCTKPGAIDATCIAQCQEGYIPVGGLPPTVKYICQEVPGTADWAWQVVGGGQPLTCLRQCPDSPPLPGQIWHSGGAADARRCGPAPYTDQTCKVECGSGYHWADGSNAQCRADADSVEPACADAGDTECCDCLQRLCGTARLEGLDQCKTCLNTVDTTHCKCDSIQTRAAWCVEPPVNPDMVGWYTCTDGAWTRNSVNAECQCTPNVCPAFKDDQLVRGGSGCAAAVYSSNQTISGCEIECRDGYTKFSGDQDYRCSTSGQWKPTKRKLVCRKACRQRLPVSHADPTGCSGQSGRALPIVGEYCTAQCEKGWIESGALQYKCTDNVFQPPSWVALDGEFHCVLPEDAKPCTYDAPSKNMRVDGCNHTLPGAECNATCIGGFEPKTNDGDAGFSCDAGGRWVPNSLDPKKRLECVVKCRQGEAPDVGEESCTVCERGDKRPGCPPSDPLEHFALVVTAGAGVALILLWAMWRLDLCPVWLVDFLCPRPGHSPESVLRQSFLGSHKMVRLLFVVLVVVLRLLLRLLLLLLLLLLLCVFLCLCHR